MRHTQLGRLCWHPIPALCEDLGYYYEIDIGRPIEFEAMRKCYQRVSRSTSPTRIASLDYRPYRMVVQTPYIVCECYHKPNGQLSHEPNMKIKRYGTCL